MAPSLASASLLSLAGIAAASASPSHLVVSSPAKVPTGASWSVPHDFASFSFPAHFFKDYAGNTTHPNFFSRDIFDLLYSKTGAHPFIRVGGTSTDRVWYNASQKVDSYNWYNESSITAALGIADRVYIGPAFFGGFNNFPGTHWSWQINMGIDYGEEGGLDNAMEVAKLVMDHVQDRLESFEIGNEPEYFVTLGERQENYTIDDYVRDWNKYADAASERVLKGNKYRLDETRFFQGGTFMSAQDEEWNVENAFAHGMDSKGHVKTMSYHQYAAGNQGWVRLQNSYMNHTAVTDNVTQYESAIDFCHSYEPFVPLVLGETNSNGYNLNMSQVEGVFGSALWLIDHLMTGMAHNITRYNLIQGTTFGYSGWVPVVSGGRNAYVRAPLYGQIFAADVLGHHPAVQVYNVPGLPWNMSAYGVYESGHLVRYVVINFDQWNTTTPYERPVQSIRLDVPRGVDSVNVRRLTGNGASADEDIQWAGQSWNYTDGRLVENGKEIWETARVNKGVVHLDIPSTEAMMVSLAYGPR